MPVNGYHHGEMAFDGGHAIRHRVYSVVVVAPLAPLTGLCFMFRPGGRRMTHSLSLGILYGSIPTWYVLFHSIDTCCHLAVPR